MRLINANELRKSWAKAYLKIANMVDEMPTIEAEPTRHGVWIENDNGTYSCSECQSWIPKEQHYYARYCLHCGARMEAVE